MPKRSPEALLRSERVLVVVLTLALTAVSAMVGAAAAYRPHAEVPRTTVLMAAKQAPAPVPVISPAMVAKQVSAEQLIKNKLLAEHRCLSEAMYYEARGEGVDGQKAVAEVIFHRMRTGNYGNSICAVVYEGANRPHCQFSFVCNGELRHKKAGGAWMRAQVLAARILTGEEPLRDVTEGATNFHASSVQPDWANDLIRTVQIGNHIFYRSPHSRAL